VRIQNDCADKLVFHSREFSKEHLSLALAKGSEPTQDAYNDNKKRKSFTIAFMDKPGQLPSVRTEENGQSTQNMSSRQEQNP
jgi:hypothetical protein